MKHVVLVVPLYNEEGNIDALLTSIENVFAALPAYSYEVILVDDGSRDNSLQVVKQKAQQDPRVKYISFSRNFGHQNALKAGLDMADGDCVISMDADMQHPPSLIPTMLQHWEAGFDVVYTVRQEGADLSAFKKRSSSTFYQILNWLSEIDVEQGTPDFRLIGRNVLNELKRLNEYDLFFRGLVKWVGFKQISIPYQQEERFSGKSKYTLKKMMRFALQGITSFSIRPLYAAAYLGFAISLLSLLYLPYALYSYYFGRTISGWASVIVTIAFFGGLQLTILGIIGIYLGKLFMQSKGRPLYIIKETNLYERS
ncbi:glycosyltransferase family 2 protein [Aridibaculum aurantiacum]|uniref:glycosyltransferase family 2 protein n=1 Tax=Aridibaculum aurantiacum TaxID=2810307 RepID=UPI001A969F48|nr:glycosyltransferase family 2 protein [Aridibaculum aurantiacum]